MSAQDPAERLKKLFGSSFEDAGGVDLFGSIFSRVKPVVACGACGQKNRIKPGKRDARCGACGLPLKNS